MTGTATSAPRNSHLDSLARLRELDKRRAAISASLQERGLLSEELSAKIDGAAAAGSSRSVAARRKVF